MQYYLKMTDEFGRGLYSMYDIFSNKVLFTAELLVLNEEDTKLINQTDLKYYVFKYNDKQDCLVLGDGEIFNHSDEPNVGYKLIDYDNRKVMIFYTIKPVKTDDQLFINYSADVQVDPKKYNINLTGC